MKKYLVYIIFLAISVVLLASCGTDTSIEPITKTTNGNNQALSDEVIEMHGSIENIEKLDNFIKNVQSQRKDKVTLTRYTIEGDPIYYKLNYDSSKLELTIDSSKDKYGSGEILLYECKSANKIETNTETKYMLEGCPDQQTGDLLTISHDVDRQDYFAFDLKFGPEKKNEINTKDQKLDLDAGFGNRVAVSDFQFSKEEMNNIYKLMILSNYLKEKKLTSKCSEKSDDTYDLTVWINSGERHFEWGSCDTSKDGKEMTKLAEDILNVLKQNEAYKSLDLK